MSPIKAIETIYNDYKFRSRTEARWAVFFDTLGIEYNYELEGFDLGQAGWYLPDFWLPQLHWWIEIKGQPANHRELAMAETLSKMSGQWVIILSGVPGRKKCTAVCFTPLEEHSTDYSWDEMIQLLCRQMTFVQLGIDFITDDWSSKLHSTFRHQLNSNVRLADKACTAARRARFEHGQIGTS